MTSSSIWRDGIEIPFEIAGEHGPCLLFGHGLTASGLGSTGSLAPLLDAGWRVVVMDQRGHGRAGRPADAAGFALEAMGADLVAIADAVEPDRRVVFGGGSMGAATASAAAALAPHRTAGLALVAPAFTRGRAPGLEPFFGIGAAYATGNREAGEHAWLRLLRSVGADDAGIEQHLVMQRQIEVEVLAMMMATIPGWQLDQQLDTLVAHDLPAVVIAWEGDSIHPMSIAEEIADTLPRATLHRWDLARDGLDPDALGRVLLEHLTPMVASDDR